MSPVAISIDSNNKVKPERFMNSPRVFFVVCRALPSGLAEIRASCP